MNESQIYAFLTQLFFAFLENMYNRISTLLIICVCLTNGQTAYGQMIGSHRKVIPLADNTKEDVLVASNVLFPDGLPSTGLDPSQSVTYALLKTPVNAYFRVDEHTGRLTTRHRIDRDRLCPDSGLCCPPSGTGGLSPKQAGGLSKCTLKLDVAVVTPGQAPITHSIMIEVNDENDHAPRFIVSSMNVY